MGHKMQPAVSSCYGKIKHILLIFPEYLIKQKRLSKEGPEGVINEDAHSFFASPNEIEGIKLQVLAYFKPITDAFSRSSGRVLFDFLVEHKIKLKPDKNPRGSSKDGKSNDLLGISPLEWLKESEPDNGDLFGGYHDPIQHEDKKFYYRILFTNIDFDEVANEAMQALDISSNVLSLKDTKELFYSIQDPFVPLRAGRQVVILEPFFSWPTVRGFRSPFNFKSIPEVLSSQTEILTKAFPFYLQGGNILVGHDYVLMGGDVVKKNVDAYADVKADGTQSLHGISDSPEDKCKQNPVTLKCFPNLLAKFLGMEKGICVDAFAPHKEPYSTNPIVPAEIRNNLPELFHLDIFLTLGGRTRDNKELVLLGEINVWGTSSNEWNPLSLDHATGRLRVVIGYLNACEIILRKHDFIVRRIPLLYESHQFFSYNNCLVEVTKTCKLWSKKLIKYRSKIYLPKYHWQKLHDCCHAGTPDFCKADQKVTKLLEGLGFKVVLIDMKFRVQAHSRVGLHCMTSVLARYDHSLTRV
jgi:hypothetical protein